MEGDVPVRSVAVASEGEMLTTNVLDMMRRVYEAMLCNFVLSHGAGNTGVKWLLRALW